MVKFIPPCRGRITSYFRVRTHPITGKQTMHWGLDYGNSPQDNAIVAVASGTVTASRFMNGYGNTVMITHMLDGKLYTTVYAHLAKLYVKQGQSVKQGAVIALKGTTGSSTGIHLHFELHTGSWNNVFTHAVDPLKYITDADTKEAQNLLVKAGYKVDVDGVLGQGTWDAIKAFQAKHKLTADGLFGPVTRKALEDAGKPVAKPIVKPASKPKEVKPVEKTRFSDVPKTHPEYDELELVVKAGLLNGFPDGTFRMDENLTRRQIVTILAKLLKKG